MKCPICNLVEMRVIENNGKEITLECPSCGEKAKLEIKEETAKE